MNRIWHHHFGHGIVGTLNDFGHMGEVTVAPAELLDWLAVEFRDGGQSIKKLHRLDPHQPDISAKRFENPLEVNDR